MAIPAYDFFGLTGDATIDATTHGYYWRLNPDKSVDWSLSDGFLGETWNNPSAVVGHLQALFATFSYYANINFNYVGYFSTPAVSAAYGGSEINISLSQSTSVFPSVNFWAIGNFDPRHSLGYFGDIGDVFLNIRSAANSLPSYEPGSAGWFVFMHEIGHTLGLKHPHDDGGTSRPTFAQVGFSGLNEDWASIMSYSEDYSWNNLQWDPATPMILDVLALQYIYGKNMSTNVGDSTFYLSQSNTYMTIWDASGNDTVSAAGSYVNWTIALPNFRASNLVDTKAGDAFPSSEATLASPLSLYWLAGDIENAVGGYGNDSITGTDDDNSLQGGGGSDTLYGGVGNDTFDWLSGNRAGNDVFYGGTGDDVFFLDSAADQVIEYSSEGVDTIWAGFDCSIANHPYIENLSGMGSIGLMLTGNDFGNVVSGTVSNDTINGGGGNDRIAGGAGNDHLDGGVGIDTVVFPTNRARYTLTKAATSWTIGSGFDGVDTIQNVERIKFSDSTVALDSGGIGGQAYRIYQAAFNRTPDSGGLGFWISVMDGGANLKGVADGFVASAEFKAVYGVAPTNAEIITKLYDNVLHRPGEAGGYNFWLGILDRHDGTIADVLAAFSESPENQAGVISVIGNGFEYTPFG